MYMIQYSKMYVHSYYIFLYKKITYYLKENSAFCQKYFHNKYLFLVTGSELSISCEAGK